MATIAIMRDVNNGKMRIRNKKRSVYAFSVKMRACVSESRLRGSCHERHQQHWNSNHSSHEDTCEHQSHKSEYGISILLQPNVKSSVSMLTDGTSSSTCCKGPGNSSLRTNVKSGCCVSTSHLSCLAQESTAWHKYQHKSAREHNGTGSITCCKASGSSSLLSFGSTLARLLNVLVKSALQPT